MLEVGAHNGKVLVIEDTLAIRAPLVELLEAEGYTVECAADGREAISNLQASELPPMLVLVDLLLPEVDGYELLQFLEGTERLSKVPVVVMTALRQPPLPADLPVLHKPFGAELLLKVVREVCAGRA